MADKTPYGDVPYADPGYQQDKKKRYPIDTVEHAKAAWSYINQADNASIYSAGDLAQIKARITAALKKFGVDVNAKAAQFPTESLVRMLGGDDAIRMNSTDDGDGNTLVGHFATYNRWAEINSAYEGHFMERVAPGAFDRTFKERAGKIKVLYDHGKDPSIGNKPLGVPSVLRSDNVGAYYEVPLFDAGYVNDLKPAIRAGALGASWRFGIPSGGETWERAPQAHQDNPDQLPERTIIDADLYEFGPVTFPAYADASAGLRSGTDEFFERLMADPVFAVRVAERVGPNVAERLFDASPHRMTAHEASKVYEISESYARLDERADEETEVVDDVRASDDDRARRRWLASWLFGERADMTCPNCGNTVDSGQDSCPDCGQPLHAAPMSAAY